MSKTILAIYIGRKGGTSEVIAKTALKAAHDQGHETMCVNVMDMNIRPCINCMICTRILSDDEFQGHCPLDNDDVSWLDEKVLQADGVIFVAPMYEKAIPGKLKMLFDRWGPSHDVTFKKYAYQRRIERGIEPKIDPRWFKIRPAVVISHGGSEWGHLGFPTLATPCVSLGMPIVAQAHFDWNVPILTDGRLSQVTELGRKIAHAVQDPNQEPTYSGAPGHCPFCHNDVMKLSQTDDTVLCTLCGVQGRLTVCDGNIRVLYDEDAVQKTHMYDNGRGIHLQDLQNNAKNAISLDRQACTRARSEAIDWLPTLKPGD